MHGDDALPGSAPESNKHDTTATRWPYHSPYAWAMPPARRKRQRGRRGRLREEEALARLRKTWQDTYKMPEPLWRRWPARTELTALNLLTGRTLRKRSADTLEQAVLEDYGVMLAEAIRARAATEDAAAGAPTQAVPVITLPLSPRPYVSEGDPR